MIGCGMDHEDAQMLLIAMRPVKCIVKEELFNIGTMDFEESFTKYACSIKSESGNLMMEIREAH